jgi:hypothetical protein
MKSRLGSVWEVSGKCLGSVWEVFGKCLGSVWEVSADTQVWYSLWNLIGVLTNSHLCSDSSVSRLIKEMKPFI